MISPMKKVLLAGRPREREQVLSTLRTAGVVHVEPVFGIVPVPADLAREVDRARQAQTCLAGVTPADDGLAPPGTPARLIGEIIETVQEMASIDARLQAIQREVEAVRPWGRIDHSALADVQASGLDVALLQGPGESQAEVRADCLQVLGDNDGVVSLVAASRTPLVVPASWVRVEIPEKDIVVLQEELVLLRDKKRHLGVKLTLQAKRRADVEGFLADLLERQRFAEVEAGLLHDESGVFVLQGWVPAAGCAGLAGAFDAAGLSVALHLEEPDSADNPPTKLENARWCNSIEDFYGLLGLVPGYREVDITPTFLPFMVIFTSMLIGDAGYGLLAVLALAALFRPLTNQGVSKKLLEFFIILFSGTVVYGVVTNTWFGERLPYGGFDGSTASGKVMLQELCFLLGAVHLSIAQLWKGQRGPKTLAFLSEVGWTIFIWFIYGLVRFLVLKVPLSFWVMPSLYVSCFLILFFTAPNPNPLKAIGAGLGALALNVASFLSDLISYIRLWAVGLASGILAHSFNEMAMQLPFLVMILVLVVGHLINLGLGLVAVFAHGVRLNLLEFSNHLGMEWSGRDYDPFRKR